jgi:PAS domain-containing protein
VTRPTGKRGEQRMRARPKFREELERNDSAPWRLVDSIPGPIVMLTKTGDVDMVNRHLLEYFGTTIERTRQWGTNDLVHPEDRPRLIELFTQSIGGALLTRANSVCGGGMASIAGFRPVRFLCAMRAAKFSDGACC